MTYSFSLIEQKTKPCEILTKGFAHKDCNSLIRKGKVQSNYRLNAHNLHEYWNIYNKEALKILKGSMLNFEGPLNSYDRMWDQEYVQD